MNCDEIDREHEQSKQHVLPYGLFASCAKSEVRFRMISNHNIYWMIGRVDNSIAEKKN